MMGMGMGDGDENEDEKKGEKGERRGGQRGGKGKEELSRDAMGVVLEIGMFDFLFF